MKNGFRTNFILVWALLLSTVTGSVQAQTKISVPFLSYDLAFFELKGKVRAVYLHQRFPYSEFNETHYFNRNGELEDDDEDDFFAVRAGCIRDDKGRIIGTGNGHCSWSWNGKLLVRLDWAHMGSESSEVYLYNQNGTRVGKKTDGKVHKYVYLNHDAKGNWTERYCEEEKSYEERRIVYY